MYRRPSDPEKWREFWDYIAAEYAAQNRNTEAFHTTIIDFLVGKGAIGPDSVVLDIGCGPGTYTLPMARVCHRVTGIDTSEMMLATLCREAAVKNLADKVRTRFEDWATLRETASYDLVFGALTPAVKDPSSLLKMHRFSRNFCCLISFGGRYRSSL